MTYQEKKEIIAQAHSELPIADWESNDTCIIPSFFNGETYLCVFNKVKVTDSRDELRYAFMYSFDKFQNL